MLCHAAMIAPAPGVSENESVQTAMELLSKSKAGIVPVIDDSGILVGAFSISSVLKSIMPVTVPVAGGFMPDVQLPAAPGMTKRLEKIMQARLHEVMDRKPPVAGPGSSLTDAIALLLAGNAAIIVIEPESKKPLGVITPESAYLEISRMKDSR